MGFDSNSLFTSPFSLREVPLPTYMGPAEGRGKGHRLASQKRGEYQGMIGALSFARCADSPILRCVLPRLKLRGFPITGFI